MPLALRSAFTAVTKTSMQVSLSLTPTANRQISASRMPGTTLGVSASVDGLEETLRHWKIVLPRQSLAQASIRPKLNSKSTLIRLGPWLPEPSA